MAKHNVHMGSSFDEFLEEEGIFGETERILSAGLRRPMLVQLSRGCRDEVAHLPARSDTAEFAKCFFEPPGCPRSVDDGRLERQTQSPQWEGTERIAGHAVLDNSLDTVAPRTKELADTLRIFGGA